jgi:hypothetical protein
MLHPVWLTGIGIWIIFNHHFILKSKLTALSLGPLYFVIFLSTVLLPVMTGMIITGTQHLSKLPTIEIKHRSAFLMSGAVYTSLLVFFFTKASLEIFVLPFMIGQVLIQIIGAIFNLKMKISLHGLGWGGITAMLYQLIAIGSPQVFRIFLAAIFLSGLVLSARLIVKAHTRFEIYLGYSAGFLIMMLILFCFAE